MRIYCEKLSEILNPPLSGPVELLCRSKVLLYNILWL